MVGPERASKLSQRTNQNQFPISSLEELLIEFFQNPQMSYLQNDSNIIKLKTFIKHPTPLEIRSSSHPQERDHKMISTTT